MERMEEFWREKIRVERPSFHGESTWVYGCDSFGTFIWVIGSFESVCLGHLVDEAKLKVLMIQVQNYEGLIRQGPVSVSSVKSAHEVQRNFLHIKFRSMMLASFCISLMGMEGEIVVGPAHQRERKNERKKKKKGRRKKQKIVHGRDINEWESKSHIG